MGVISGRRWPPPVNMMDMVYAYGSSPVATYDSITLSRQVQNDRNEGVPGADEFFWTARKLWLIDGDVNAAIAATMSLGGSYVERLLALEVAKKLEES